MVSKNAILLFNSAFAFKALSKLLLVWYRMRKSKKNAILKIDLFYNMDKRLYYIKAILIFNLNGDPNAVVNYSKF